MSHSDPEDGPNGGDDSVFYDAEGWCPIEDWDLASQDAKAQYHQAKDVPHRYYRRHDAQPSARSPGLFDALPVSMKASIHGHISQTGRRNQVDAVPASPTASCTSSSTSPTAGRSPPPPWWPTLSKSGFLNTMLWTGVAVVAVAGTAALLYNLKMRKTKTAACSTTTLLSINCQALDDEQLVHWCTDPKRGSNFSSWRKITDHDCGGGGSRSIAKR